MYDYYFDHWEVEVSSILSDGYTCIKLGTLEFDNEEDAVAYANKRYADGKRVKLKVVQSVEGWIDINK